MWGKKSQKDTDPVFRIRFDLNTDPVPDPAFQVNTDPDPDSDPGFFMTKM